MRPWKKPIDILVRLQEAQEICLARSFTKKDNEVYRKLIIDVMIELDCTFKELNRKCGVGFHRHVIGPNAPIRYMRALIYSCWAKEISAKRDALLAQ